MFCVRLRKIQEGVGILHPATVISEGLYSRPDLGGGGLELDKVVIIAALAITSLARA